ncbi:MAG: D-amino acid dehydrogenase [Rhodospirillales bacterium]|nr:D-amino acid dehydrogenase [Rhodospirillales bacterium]
MKIIVLGGGVIGVTTAWFLSRDGHDVTVIDREETVADGTSFANAGLLSPGHAFAWARPGVPATLLRSFWRDDTGLRLRPRLDPAMWSWGIKFLAQCTHGRARVNSLRKLRISAYSQDVLHDLIADTGIAFDHGRGGILYLHRDAAALDRGIAEMRLLVDEGVRMEVLDAQGCARVEPALAHLGPDLAGAVYCPDDEHGDCNKFTRALGDLAAGAGVTFQFNTTIQGIEADGASIARVLTDNGDFTADAYVMALGPQSPLVARGLGVKLPIYPVKGYSMTFPVTSSHQGPIGSGVDEGLLMAWSRLGDRLRLTSTAEIAGYDLSRPPAQYAAMRRAAESLFPGGADYDHGEVWCGLRPLMPEGTPIFGRGRHKNLWFNTGHGSMGWTMACGSARVTADLIAGRNAGIDLTGMVLVE